MIDQGDLDYYLKVFRNTSMTKRELERSLRAAGLSRQMSKIIAAKCGRPFSDNIKK